VSPVRRIQWKKRYKRYVAGALALITVAAAGVATYTGGSDAGVPGPVSDSTAVTLFDMRADEDFGALSTRTAFCDSSATGSQPAHCWLFGGTGNISDSGSGSWTLTKNGSPRTEVETGLPVLDSGSVSWTGEESAYVDSTGNYSATSGAYSSSVISMTAVWQRGGYPLVAYPLDFGWGSGTYGVYFYTSGTTRAALVKGASGSPTITFTAPDHSLEWLCTTWVIDGLDSVGYENGSALVTAADGVHGAITDTGQDIKLPGNNSFPTTVARVRVDYAALTLAQHQSLCGGWGAPTRRDHSAFADISWTQTGGTRCFATGASTAHCFAGGAPAYAYSSALDAVADEDGYGWAVEPGRINKLTESTDISAGGGWTFRGTATSTAGKVAPDESATAHELSLGAGGVDDIFKTVATYSADVTVYPRVWVKCSSGSLSIKNAAGATKGEWTVACATVSAGAWVQIYDPASQSGVSQVAAWSSSGAAAGMWFHATSGTVTASVWLPTLTETDGLSVIPTAAAAVDSGSIAWTLANANPYPYYKASAGRITVIGDARFSTFALDIINPRTWYTTATDIRINNSGGTGVSLCAHGAGAGDAAEWDSWWNSVAGTAGLSIDSVPVVCGTSPGGSWTPGTSDTVRFSVASQPHTGIYSQIKIEDRP
jgi:hypothetical protein